MRTPSGRLTSLDAFRGATVAAMIMVNNPGAVDAIYPQLRHSVWNGWTFADLIFPFFLWIMGVAMTLSFAKRRERGADRRELLLHTFRRSAVIFALGLFLNALPFFSLSTMRIPGVLQRIAVCYLAAAVLFLYTRWREQAIWVGVLLAGYWALIEMVPVPGYGAGILTRQGNLVRFIDNLFLHGHLYNAARGWDPEGILSTIPALATTLLGVLCGHILRSWRLQEEKAVWLFVIGNSLLAGGLFMSVWLPINKNLWTSSYAVFTAGVAANVFALCYWLMDVKGYKRWVKPFAIYGMNALAIYVLAGVLGRLAGIGAGAKEGGGLPAYVYKTYFAGLFGPQNASLLFSLMGVGLFYLIVHFLYSRRWFIRI